MAAIYEYMKCKIKYSFGAAAFAAMYVCIQSDFKYNKLTEKIQFNIFKGQLSVLKPQIVCVRPYSYGSKTLGKVI